MPATKFICPDGSSVPVLKCLNKCPHAERCMFLPTLRAVAAALDRKLPKATVTELLCGTREIYLKKTTEYAVNPQQQLYALHGTAVHTINEAHTEGNMLSEERLADEITSGQFDLYGQIADYDDATLGDFKVTSSYKLMRALGYYKVDMPTGEVYKTGVKKGQPKTRKEWRMDGVKHLLDWAVQLNYYRMLLEARGFKVDSMKIQALCRDYNLRIASERNIRKPAYIIPINRISDRWVKLYVSEKAKRLQAALDNNALPPVCTVKERWHDRKCLSYCAVAENCPYGRMLKEKMQAKAA